MDLDTGHAPWMSERRNADKKFTLYKQNIKINTKIEKINIYKLHFKCYFSTVSFLLVYNA
jgi:hypothetical protein